MTFLSRPTGRNQLLSEKLKVSPFYLFMDANADDTESTHLKSHPHSFTLINSLLVTSLRPEGHQTKMLFSLSSDWQQQNIHQPLCPFNAEEDNILSISLRHSSDRKINCNRLSCSLPSDSSFSSSRLCPFPRSFLLHCLFFSLFPDRQGDLECTRSQGNCPAWGCRTCALQFFCCKPPNDFNAQFNSLHH